MKDKRIIIGLVLVVVIGSIAGFGIFKIANYNHDKNLIKETKKELSHLFENKVTTPVKDILSDQQDGDKKINEALAGDYSIDNPYVLTNPYGISPLTAIVVFKTENSVPVTLELNGKTYEFESSKEHTIPIYGLAAGKITKAKLNADGKTKEITLDMTKVEDDLKVDVDAGKGKDLGNGIYVLTTAAGDGVYGFNTNGELVWRITEGFSLSITALANGHFLLADKEFILGSSRKGLVEIDYLGKIYNIYDLEGGYHDDAIVLDNGNFIVGSSVMNTGTYNDYVVEIDYKTGEVVKNWNIKTIVNSISKSFVEGLNNPYWADNNSIYYDKNTKSLILSLRGRNSVISIGYDTKKINWIFGDIKYWGNDFKDYIVTLESGKYPQGANTASINKDGNLMLFNNNFDGSVYEDQKCGKYVDNYSSGEIYKIEGKTAKLVSKFDDNESFYSYAVSNYNESYNGNYILFSAWQFPHGSMNDSDECTMNQIYKGLSSTLYETDKQNNILFKANIKLGTYRVNRVELYKDLKNYKTTSTEYYNTLDKKIYDVIKTNTILEDIKNAEDKEFALSMSENLLSINASFTQQDEVYILLVGEENITYKYLTKAKDYYLQPIVNLRNIKGKYALFIVINGEYFNLNTIYEF